MQSSAVGVEQRSDGSGVNDGETVASAYISMVQVVAVLPQAPLQPARVWVASFQLAVSVTSAASSNVIVPTRSTLPPAAGVIVRVKVGSGVVGVSVASKAQSGRFSWGRSLLRTSRRSLGTQPVRPLLFFRYSLRRLRTAPSWVGNAPVSWLCSSRSSASLLSEASWVGIAPTAGLVQVQALEVCQPAQPGRNRPRQAIAVQPHVLQAREVAELWGNRAGQPDSRGQGVRPLKCRLVSVGPIEPSSGGDCAGQLVPAQVELP